jgi:hypothetical protein
MSTTQELNLEGKWWLPNKENESRIGNLTVNQQHKQGMLSIYGSFSGTGEEDIILGELSNGQKVTLNKCQLEWRRPYLINFEKSSFIPKNILLGGHFQTQEDIIFSSVYITYQEVAFNNWIERFHTRGGFGSKKGEISISYTEGNPIRAKINDSYIITILSKPKVLFPSKEVREEYIKEVPCLEIESLKEKSLEEYIKANMVVRDFLNFIIPQEVTIESIYGIRENRKDSKENISANQQEGKEEEVKIFYASAISKMFKPTARDQPIFPYNESQRNSIQVLFEKYLNKWFELSKTPLINLYCAVMFNMEMYMQYLFLGLAQAIESYHATFLKTESAARVELEKGIKEIGNALPEKAEWLDQKFKDCYRRPFIERVKDIYHEYSAVADQFFAFKGEEKFSEKVRDTRNYLTHWSENLEKKATHGDDLVLLTKDLQFLLQLCIMTQLGFTKEDITKMYHANRV